MGSAIRRGVYNGYYRLLGRGAIPRRVAQLERFQFMPRERLEVARNERLFALVRRAVQTVPYYEQWAASQGFRPTLDTIEEDLRELPLLTKEIMRAEGENLRSRQPGHGVYRNTSGGSTGEPVYFFQDDEYRNWSFANKILYMSWCGYEPGDWHVKIWGARRDMWYGNSRRRAWVHRNILRELLLPCWEMNIRTWAEVMSKLRGLGTFVVEAYVDAMYDFSRYVLDSGVRPPVPMGIVTSAGVLTPLMRETIERAWGCMVLNRYGSREVGDGACSCGMSDDLHIGELTHYIEVLDEAGRPCAPGVEGDIVVTLLSNYTMPVLRFKIGDRAIRAAGPCPCGRTTQRLAAITGRSIDYVLADDGTRINGVALTTLLYRIEGIRQYQFHQGRTGEVELRVIPREGHDAARLRQDLGPVLGRIQGLLGPGRRLSLAITDTIHVTPTGKHRYVISELIGQ